MAGPLLLLDPTRLGKKRLSLYYWLTCDFFDMFRGRLTTITFFIWGTMLFPWRWISTFFFSSNAFMASARSLHTFVRGKQLNCSLHAGLSPCRKPQKCRLWTSTQSRNCPIKRTRKQKSKPKTTQQKQEKHTTKTKTKQRRQREVGSQPAMGITCMMTSYVSF